MIDVAAQDGYAVATIAELERLSAHDVTYARNLTNAMFDVLDDDDAKVVIIRSAGPDFCPPVGRGSTGDRFEPSSTAAWINAFAGPRSLAQLLTFAKKVVIAEVHGACDGAGIGLILAADLAIASGDATFTAPFARHPEVNYALAALTMRTHRARAWALTEGPMSADEACRTGLVNEVVDRAALAERAEAMAQEAARTPLDGVTLTKMMRQAVLDTQGVGQEFDAAPFLLRSQPPWRAGLRGGTP